MKKLSVILAGAFFGLAAISATASPQMSTPAQSAERVQVQDVPAKVTSQIDNSWAVTKVSDSVAGKNDGVGQVTAVTSFAYREANSQSRVENLFMSAADEHVFPGDASAVIVQNDPSHLVGVSANQSGIAATGAS